MATPLTASPGRDVTACPCSAISPSATGPINGIEMLRVALPPRPTATAPALNLNRIPAGAEYFVVGGIAYPVLGTPGVPRGCYFEPDPLHLPEGADARYFIETKAARRGSSMLRVEQGGITSAATQAKSDACKLDGGDW